MGNKLGRKRQAIDDKYTRPQGLYQNIDVDYKKLRKLILKSRLAPCYPGDEESSNDREECPICLLYYPSLNRSRCCMKGICTECYLQMKSFHSLRRCPFCKSFNYGVDYRGVMTKEEKDLEQIEEQKIIEARIRMQQQERIEGERLEREIVERRELPSGSNSGQNDEIVSSHVSPSLPASRRLLQPRQRRADEFDADLEDLMVMEAIWASICDSGLHVGGGPFPGPSSTAGQAGGHGAEADVSRGSVGPVRRVGEGEDYLGASGRGDSFEKQMMLALAISLAEASSRRTDSGVTKW